MQGMSDSPATLPPETVLVPSNGDEPPVTQADIDGTILALFSVNGEYRDLCILTAAIVAQMARRIHQAGWRDTADPVLSTRTDRAQPRIALRLHSR